MMDSARSRAATAIVCAAVVEIAGGTALQVARGGGEGCDRGPCLGSRGADAFAVAGGVPRVVPVAEAPFGGDRCRPRHRLADRSCVGVHRRAGAACRTRPHHVGRVELRQP